MAPARRGDVPWLSDRELAAWLALGRVVLRLPSVLDSLLEHQAGLSFFEYQVLAMLSQSPNRALRMSALADETCSSLSRLSHTVTRLELQGFVERRRCEGVGRSTLAVLTTRGHATLRRAAPAHVASVRALVVDALSPAQLAALASISSTIMEQIDEVAAS